MATQKPISTISYNTEDFLLEKLNQWLKAHIIQSYMYIKHIGEDGDKDHIHLRIEPNKKLDPMDLTEQLKEYPFGSDKPLGCRTWRSSKEEDWFLYVVHDEEYLKSKYSDTADGKIPYDMEDIKVNEDYDLRVAFVRAQSYKKHSVPNVLKRMKDGAVPSDLVQEGENPFVVKTLMSVLSSSDYNNLQKQYDKLYSEYVELKNAVTRSGYVFDFDEEGSLCISPKDILPFEDDK